MLNKVKVKGVSRPYEVLIGNKMLDRLPELMECLVKAKKVVIITDDNVDKFYGERILKSFEDSRYEALKFVFCHGEENKSIKTVEEILEFMAQNSVTRSDCIIALGGGITGDISGFCAASYLRGIDFIQVPTTFLAAIDSSVGGKTGVNLKAGKNLAGAFYQPRLVICDTDTFDTLPAENFKEGVCEAIKYGVICDKNLFEKFMGDISQELSEIITRCVTIKSEIVSRDEFDTGERQLLNFGHTIGHAIEKCTNFSISHGIAVGIGMAMIAKASEVLGYSKEPCFDKIKAALKKNGIPYKCNCTPDELIAVMGKDKKRMGDSITFVIPEKIGKCVLMKTQISHVRDVVNNAV